MNVKSIEKEGSKAKITVEIEKDLMDSGANKAYLKARKDIQLPGFRKGKAPRKLIEFRLMNNYMYVFSFDFFFISLFENHRIFYNFLFIIYQKIDIFSTIVNHICLYFFNQLF